MMRAVRLIEPGKPLQLYHVAVPDVGPRDVLVRVRAAGICHSDAHYRAGISPVRPLPVTLGHEAAGVVEKAGSEVAHLKPGDRVCLHYLATCGDCLHCRRGQEQFCLSGQMMGKHREGAYAEYVCMPARSAFRLPDNIPFEQGAVMMCSSSTSLHALLKAGLRAGESVAVFGAGGLGMSAIQLASALGAARVFAVDRHENKLAMARRYGAVPVDASRCDPVEEIRRLTEGRGVDVALELIGLPLTMRQAVLSLGIQGRTAIAGITGGAFEIAPYEELINKEAEIIGVSDHLAQEIPLLLDLAARGRLDLTDVVSRRVPLEADEINQVLDELTAFGTQIRAVIVP